MVRTKSLLRLLQYDVLGTLTIDGKILDIGGSKRSGYHELLKGTHEITTANIDESYDTDLTFDAEKPWPVPQGSYDAVLFINVLEHLYGHREALKEAHAALKEGGEVHIMVPFMFNVHGSPGDYFRYTGSALTRLLEDAGFTDIEVRELGTGAFSVVYHALIAAVPNGPIARMCMALAKGMDGLISKIRPESSMSARAMPLGYYARARR